MKALRIVIPLALGLVAAGLNFYVVRGMVEPLELTAVKANKKADEEIKGPEDLERVLVRSDSKVIFKSAIPWADRGLAVNRKVNRPLAAGEVLLFADVRGDGADDVRDALKSGEKSCTFPVRASRVAPGVRRDVDAVVVVAGDDPGAVRVLGPFRVLAVGERSNPFRATDEVRSITVAVPVAGGKPTADGQLLEAAASPGDGADRRDRIVAVEFSKK